MTTIIACHLKHQAAPVICVSCSKWTHLRRSIALLITSVHLIEDQPAIPLESFRNIFYDIVISVVCVLTAIKYFGICILTIVDSLFYNTSISFRFASLGWEFLVLKCRIFLLLQLYFRQRFVDRNSVVAPRITRSPYVSNNNN